jgi:hypothetical protein
VISVGTDSGISSHTIAAAPFSIGNIARLNREFIAAKLKD